jgi:glutathione S-transferase
LSGQVFGDTQGDFEMNETMKKLILLIGDRNVSTWSMRPWLVITKSGLAFEEQLIKLDTPQTAKTLKRLSPNGKVPLLIHGKTKIWDSLAICEYLAELAPDKKLWPKSSVHRAMARSMVAEMHSGFQSLRSQLSMDIQLRMKIKHLTPSTIADIQRIIHLWDHSLRVLHGPFIFGEFSIVDAFFAPVVMRFQSYGIVVKNPIALRYMNSILSYPSVKEWVKAARSERPEFMEF